MQYREVVERDRAEIHILLSSGDRTNILDALLSAAYYDQDWRWSQGLCLEFLRHDDLDVRRMSATCLGPIARVHEQLDLDLVLSELALLKNDPYMGSTVQDALEDIRFLLKFQ